MKLSFGVKLAAALSAISVGVTNASVYFFYTTTYEIIMNQMAERLKNFGHTGSFLFDGEARTRISRLSAIAQKESLPVTSVMQGMKPGDVKMSLLDKTAENLMQSEDYQQLVQILRRIDELYAALVQHLNLKWVYKSTDLKTEIAAKQTSTTMIIPSTTELKELLSHVETGYFRGIKEELDKLAELNEQYQLFVQQLRELTKGFNIQKIRHFLRESMS